MVAIVSMLVGVALALCVCVVETNQPNRSKLVLYKLLIRFNGCLQQLYLSNKTVCFSLKVGLAYVSIHVSQHLKLELACYRSTALGYLL